ncbi:MAG: sulfatase-like hydrolase/transferase, partial [Verrucomicrobia bacterium]|nr:sulfatase-like hydrolase/transferase [Verrucomicrobiota bacterium]
MKIFIIPILLILVAYKASSAEPAPRPNILYFFIDDMGWGSIGHNGQAARKAKGLPYVRTPNIDRLAEQGVNFTRGYACHVCSPSRSSQQSGFHQGHTFADNNDPNNARKAMRADDLLMGDVLSSSGYTTGYWGKWGYGGSKDLVNPTIDNIQSLPTSHGYAHVLAELHHVRAHTFFQPTLWSAPAIDGAIGGIELIPNSIAKYAKNPTYLNTPAYQDHRDYPTIGYCDDAYAFAALDFVRTNAQNYNKTGKPFFGLLASQIPHAPFGDISQLPKWNEVYKNDPFFSKLPTQAQQWAAMVTRIDAHIGNILAALDDPNHDGDTSDSVTENTLVIFQSDNGGPGGSNNTTFDSNGGLRGTKGKIQEGGIRVPLVMRWPLKINSKSKLKAGTDSAKIVDVTDLLPTFSELAGAPIPLSIDGVSIAPMLRGYGHQRQREFIIHEASNGQSIIHGKHKLIRTRIKGNKNTPLELYDLETDHAEENNIAANHPTLVNKLHALLLGERVTEVKGFANTYHYWNGGADGQVSNPANWSDYAYANKGITYLSDKGAPRLSWTSRIENKGNTHSTVRANTDLEFLGLEICGTSETETQTLSLNKGVKLNGRNEIRISNYGKVSINGSTLTSLRWVDIQSGGMLYGNGTIDAILYNNGEISTSYIAPLSVTGDYHETENAKLIIKPAGNA